METISGLGKESRNRLARVMRETKGTVSVRQVADILQLTPARAAKMLSRWASQGWVSRVQRGLYVFIPIEARSTDIALEDPWIVADQLFSPCYIGVISVAGVPRNTGS